jgi:hypothetical protein
MSTRLSDRLIQVLCMERSKMQASDKTNGTSTRIIHATDKLDGIANKLRQIHNITNILSSNTGSDDEANVQAPIVDGPIRGPDALDIIDARLDQLVDRQARINDRFRRATEESN